MKQVVLITGASRGLGKIIANFLSEKGYIVYGGVRTENAQGQEELFIPIQLDVTRSEDIQRAVQKIKERHNKIDVLIHNAGVLYAGPPDSFTESEIRQLFEVNVFGAVRLTQEVLPLMREQKSGRIIFISSIRGFESHAYRGLYSATKSALEAIAFDWAVSLMPWGIKISVLEPGPLSTNPTVLEGSYFEQGNNPYPEIQNFPLLWQSPNEIGPILQEIIEEPEPVFRYQTSVNTKELAQKHLNDPSGQNWLSEQKKWFYENTQQQFSHANKA